MLDNGFKGLVPGILIGEEDSPKRGIIIISGNPIGFEYQFEAINADKVNILGIDQENLIGIFIKVFKFILNNMKIDIGVGKSHNKTSISWDDFGTFNKHFGIVNNHISPFAYWWV